MQQNPHTTKKGPGRRHVEGEYRSGKAHNYKHQPDVPFGSPGDKLRRKAMWQVLTRKA